MIFITEIYILSFPPFTTTVPSVCNGHSSHYLAFLSHKISDYILRSILPTLSFSIFRTDVTFFSNIHHHVVLFISILTSPSYYCRCIHIIDSHALSHNNLPHISFLCTFRRSPYIASLSLSALSVFLFIPFFLLCLSYCLQSPAVSDLPSDLPIPQPYHIVVPFPFFAVNYRTLPWVASLTHTATMIFHPPVPSRTHVCQLLPVPFCNQIYHSFYHFTPLYHAWSSTLPWFSSGNLSWSLTHLCRGWHIPVPFTHTKTVTTYVRSLSRSFNVYVSNLPHNMPNKQYAIPLVNTGH